MLQKGHVKELEVLPHAEKLVLLPLDDFSVREGKEYHLLVSLRTLTADPLIPVNHEVAWEQLQENSAVTFRVLRDPGPEGKAGAAQHVALSQGV